EVSALVLDVGSCWTRAGYAGEDTPKAVFPTSYGYIAEAETAVPNIDEDTIMKNADSDAPKGESSNSAFAENTLSKKEKGKYIIGDAEVAAWRSNMEIKNPLVDGLVQDWDALEKIWDHALDKRLQVDPTEHPLFVTEAAWNTREIREKLTEIAFEKYQVLAFYVAKNPVLSAFATGRPTAVVLDCGHSTTSCVPVVDGYVLKKGIYKQPVAGEFLSEQIMQQFQKLNINVEPHYLIAKKTVVEADQPAIVVYRDRPNTTESYHKYMQMFPDGFNTSFGVQRFDVPEILFNPPKFIMQPDRPSFDTKSMLGVPQMICNSVSACDVDVRPLLLNNIILTGGTTLLPGFADRVNYELSMMLHGMKIKLHAPGNTIERKCSSWLGGSILASLGTFHQLWISRKEYDDQGAMIVEKKCE
ncbi:14506_t:CDS:2, partial [Gigaspora margarita]